MKKSLLSFALILAAQVSHSADWHMITSQSDAIWFLDSSSLASVASSRTAWAKVIVYREAVPAGGMRAAVVKYAAHCKTRQLQILSWTQYVMDGSVLGSAKKPEESNEVIPDSAGESIYEMMCRSASKTKDEQKIDDTYGFTDWYFDNDKKKSVIP